jgi:polysaccharide pyruvyl transferase WcaK-like protein
MKLCILDPGIESHDGVSSSNLGDLIIQNAVNRELGALFPGVGILRYSTQKPLDRAQRKHIAACNPAIVGGTNLLSSNMSDIQPGNPPGANLIYRQWKISLLDTFDLRNLILFGVGWWQYQRPPGPFTRLLLRRILSGKMLHSVRDTYTEAKLRSIGIQNVVNTGCPTMWPFAFHHPSIPTTKARNALVMFTDYLPSPETDRKLLELLASKYERLFLWPQGRNDADYVNTLNVPVTMLEHSFAAFASFVNSEQSLDYIGTRLHGGIWCLLHGHRSLILEIDNRAAEIARDTGLPTAQRNNLERISRWIDGPSETHIKLPVGNIIRWKQQFENLANENAMKQDGMKTVIKTAPADLA